MSEVRAAPREAEESIGVICSERDNAQRAPASTLSTGSYPTTSRESFDRVHADPALAPRCDTGAPAYGGAAPMMPPESESVERSEVPGAFGAADSARASYSRIDAIRLAMSVLSYASTSINMCE